MVVMNERKYSVMELVEMLEKALPDGQVVVVGNSNCGGLTDKQKAWLHSLTDCKGECDCDECDCDCGCDECDGCDCKYTQDELDDAVKEAYDEGYADGEAHKEAEIAEAYDEGYNDAARKVMEALDI